ncbi:GNAT family N-acetyltransferase [Peribacillus frigoritolerans]|uniref:GNAT family N-acetyltransferase n=1 Tax=Peribacillus frigoritolerans TaxID=450367 RepID=UPI001059CFEC|nr:GNAT family N-acetyltransferase [Peribacillus frigoritolerans]TDL82421.1 GNAT family N-acetyltransferase [Peribacillus frigoritolerans]
MSKEKKMMEMQTEVLFKIDKLKRITGLNEHKDTAGPFLFIGRTKTGNVIRFDRTISEIEKNEILTQVDNLDLGKIILNLNKIRKINSIWLGPAFSFPESFNMTSDAIKITNENQDLLAEEFSNLMSEIEWKQPMYVIVRDGKAVSVCSSARISAAAAEASVETSPSYQGQGYATRCVISWANEVKKLGLQPLYSTAWDNFSSQSVARKLNLYQYGIDLHFS